MYDKYHGKDNRRQAIYMQWWLYPIVGLLCIIFLFIGVSIGERRSQSTPASQQVVQQPTQQVVQNQAVAQATQEQTQTAVQTQTSVSYTIGDTVSFDGLEITFLGVSVKPVDNQFADFENAVVIQATVKNISSETKGFNFLYASMFGPAGTEVDSASTYYDDSIEWAGNMRPGATLVGTFAYKYSEDGAYILELDDWINKFEVNFNVVKN